MLMTGGERLKGVVVAWVLSPAVHASIQHENGCFFFGGGGGEGRRFFFLVQPLFVFVAKFPFQRKKPKKKKKINSSFSNS